MTPLKDIKIKADWLRDKNLQSLFDVLSDGNSETKVAGGAVRNELMGEPVSDVDLCTSLLPEEVVARIDATDMKAIPTGIEHGTITVVVDGSSFEVTTLREDVETDGRHAVVKFGKDWMQDAARRDLTINALYCDRDGNVFDPLDVYGDVESREVRFIGDATERIKEDALRILRFFRFFASYGSGRPDASGLKACAANKDLVRGLSAERVWMELKKILAASDPGRALLWMRTTGILGLILPETEKWGIDTIPALIRVEQAYDFQNDPMVRLMAIIRPQVDTVQGLAERLSLSNKEAARLIEWAESEVPIAGIGKDEFSKILYRAIPQGIIDAMVIEAAQVEGNDSSERQKELVELIQFAKTWKRPVMPVQGSDLLSAGMKPGPDLGKKLSELEEAWVESGFNSTAGELMVLVDGA